MRLTFWGAAGTVTGSMHLLETGGKRYLLDCGLYQGRRKDADLKNRKLPFPGGSIDAVLLSHAHIDHSGDLPTLVQNETSGDPRLRLTYSGDVGRRNLPIIRDPERMPPADYLILESTYGGRLHKQVEHVVNKLADVVNRTARRGGRIIVPAFAVGRTQQLVLLLHQPFNENRLTNIPLFVDSPLALNVTQVHRDHPECFDEEARQYLTNGEDPFGFKRLQYVRQAVDSKKLNDLDGPLVVISASGMCEQW